MQASVAALSTRAEFKSHDRLPLAICIAFGWIAVFWGFGIHLVGHLAGREPWPPGLLHFHGLVMLSWLGLFTAQAILAMSGRVGLHQKLGEAAAPLAAAVVALSLTVSFLMTEKHLHAGDSRALPYLYRDLLDVVRFALFTGLALAWRRQPEAHRRLMVLSLLFVLVPAFARSLGHQLDPIFGATPYWCAIAHLFAGPDLLLAAIVLHEGLTQRRLHPVYAVSLPLLAIDQLLLPIASHSDVWLAMGQWLMSAP